ncbi:hypothetical protein C5167_047063 [Papaver somniferum]|uniref:F-box associated beta-propeller type 3 domain-containing protein n=2 Tax=Papaver somniferum TaxID=3469 RepID=A0A4Y7LGC3_PAPSO|nr:hypothetical protein C5167_047063 [Papaver somniferum]
MKNQKIEEKVEDNPKKKKKKMKKPKTEEDDGFQISLPIELILEFLSRLPVKSLTRLSCARELLRIIPHGVGGCYKLISSGFGFDSINNEFKLVIIIFRRETNSPKCLLFTFGIKSSWTEVRSPNCGLSRTSTSATFASYGAAAGGEALFWRTTDPQVSLLFDLHEEKLQYIRIPVERDADTRMFEHNGFLVAAVLEMKSPPVVGINTTTLEKVHFKILKAYKDDQVWDKETIDLSTYSIRFSDNFRFVSFSDQILMYWANPESFQFFNVHRKCLKVVKNIVSGTSKTRLPRAAGAKHYWLNCEVENICSLKTLLPVRAQKSDCAALNSMKVESFKDIWSPQQLKTVGGFFYSCYQSKTSESYFFLNELVDLLDGSNPTAQLKMQEPQQYHQQEQNQQNRSTAFQYLSDMRAAISAGQQVLSECSRHFNEAEEALSEGTRHFNEAEKALSENTRHFNEAENAVNHLELHINRLFPDKSE